LAGRVAIGYQFNQNFALEAGYFRTNQKQITLVTDSQKGLVVGDVALDQNAIDLVAKGILPVNSNLNVYGKLGVAYVTTDFSLNSDDERFGPTIQNIAKRKWAPEAAVGVSYDITPNVSLDTSWTHIQPLGKNRPGNIDFVAVGLGYNFG
jgi:opacity protein-like surface antigen